ncbi:MAG TPA: hypothetical protein VNQ76_03280 [Planctomicrobium sp.]|nr:hypothetical protein [Planctomicrobium sp.]
MRFASSLPYRWIGSSLALLLLLGWLVTLPAKESTPILGTEPLPEGLVLVKPQIPIELVGSLKSINEQLSEALSPADNAANFLMIVFGPDAFEPELKEFTFELLGLKKLPANSPLFVSVDEFTRHAEGLTAEKRAERTGDIQEQLLIGGEAPWTRDEYPHLAEYLDANAEALKMVAIASQKPRYYAPLLSIENPSRLLSADLTIERRLPFLARMLVARSLLHLANNDFNRCADDLVTCHKLASLLAFGSPFDVSGAKAHVIDSYAFRAEAACLDSGKLTGEQLQTFASRLRSLPPLPTADRAIDLGERAIVHQEIELLSTDTESVIGFFEDADSTAKGVPDLSKLNWKLALAQADEIWDQIVLAVKTRNRAEQDKLFETLNQQYAAWEQSDEGSDPVRFQELLKNKPDDAARTVGRDMAYSLRPYWWQRRMTDDRAFVRRDLIHLGLAALLYRDEFQKFPDTLEELAPKFIETIPAEPHSDGKYEYTRLADGRVRILSTGPNRQNDANQDYNDDQFVDLK